MTNAVSAAGTSRSQAAAQQAEDIAQAPQEVPAVQARNAFGQVGGRTSEAGPGAHQCRQIWIAVYKIHPVDYLGLAEAYLSINGYWSIDVSGFGAGDH